MRVFETVDALADAAGETVGPGEWFTIAQDRIDAFADATDDHQWIHLDPERAAAGPFGGTIAHGFLTLSLLPVLVRGLYRVDGTSMTVNYGLNKVRFPAPVRSGSRVRATARIETVTPVEGGVQAVSTVTVVPEDAGKPCCVAEAVNRYYAER